MRFLLHILVFGLVFLHAAVRAEDGLSRESELWNAAVDAYQDGNRTNAYENLQALVGTKSHGVRASSLIARMEFEAAQELIDSPTNLVDRIARLEASSQAAQAALRLKPGDKPLQENLALAAAEIPGLREEVHRQKILAAAEKESYAPLTKKSMTALRSFLSEAARLEKLAPAERIAKADELELRARDLADRCAVLKETARRVDERTPPPDEECLEALHGQVLEAASAIGDLEDGAVASVAKAEALATELYRTTLSPLQVLREDMNSQSNALNQVAPIGPRSWQQDALDYSRAFKAGLESQQLPAELGELKEKLTPLVDQLVEEQEACCKRPDAERQKKALDLGQQIIDALKEMQQNQQNQQDQQDQNQQEQDQQDQQQQDRNQQQKDDQEGGQQQKKDQQEGKQEEDQQDGRQKEDQQDGQQDQQQDQQDQEQKDGQGQEQKDEQQSEQKEDPKDASGEQDEEKDKEAEAAAGEEEDEQKKADEDLLQQVLERSMEHQAEMNKAKGGARETKLKSGKRDW